MTTRNSRSRAASKANATRKARKEFIDVYGNNTFEALVRLAQIDQGVVNPPRRISERRTLAAYRANLTRGTYAPFVAVNSSGGWTGTMNLASVVR